MSDHIYRGPWINWEHGLIGGATLTLSQDSGSLLTAFIATFVTIVGGSLWKIICYLLHQTRSSRKPQDGLYHQQQVIFRTSPTPLGASWAFFQQTICWAGRVKRSILRTLPWAVFGILYMVAIALMAVFSAEISKKSGSLRLLRSPNCGIWVTDKNSTYSEEAFNVKGVNDSLIAAAYARACYGGNHNNQTCGRNPIPSISWTSDQNATCPFQSGTCVFGDTAAYQMVSKLLDSHIDLGINAPISARVQLEKTTTCAPLRTRGYANFTNITEDFTAVGRNGDTIMDFWYGEIVGAHNTTYSYNTGSFYSATAPYTLNFVNFFPDGRNSTPYGNWAPLPAFKSNDSDVTLMFIAANSVTYREPNSDPIFSANTRLETSDGSSQGYWWADRYVGVLGCTEQYRICNAVNNKCSKKTGIGLLSNILTNNEDDLQLNTLQNATALRLISPLQVSSIYYAIFTRLAGALRVDETLQGLRQVGVPDTQWQIEAASLFDAGLARLQQKTEEYATGPLITPRGSYVVQPNDAVEDIPWKAMCHSQMVNDSSNTISFSILGMVILFGVGTIIILFSFVQDTIVGYAQTRFKVGLHAWAEWQVTDRLHMHRLLFESHNLGQWEDGRFKTVPVTQNSDTFTGQAEKHLKYTNLREEPEAGVQMIEEHFDTKQGHRY